MPNFRYLFAAVALAAVCLLIFLWSHRQKNKIETSIVGGLQQVSFALANYIKMNESLPPAVFEDADGAPLYSWRFKLHNLITSPPGPIDFESPWNAPPNSAALNWPSWVFCLSDDSPQKMENETTLFAISGDGSAFDVSMEMPPSKLPSDLIVLMETSDSGVHWMAPGDYDVVKLKRCNKSLGECVRGNLEGQIHVLFADGEIWSLRDTTPMESIKPFLTIAGTKDHSRENELGPYRIKKWTGAALMP